MQRWRFGWLTQGFAEPLQRLAFIRWNRDGLLVPSLAFGGVALLFIAVVGPLSSARDTSAARLTERRELLAWLNEKATEGRALRGSVNTNAGRRRSATGGIADVEVNLDGHGLRSSLKRLAPKSRSEFEVRFEGVSYTRLVAWLAKAQLRLGVNVISIVVDATGQPDRVDVELTAMLGQRTRQ